MRKSNESVFNSGIYARILQVQMSEADRRSAIAALHQATRIVEAIMWVKERFASVGHVFMKPSLKH